MCEKDEYFMKNGLELLKIRPLNETLDISNFEKKHSLILPCIYKVFQQTYYLRKESTFSYDKYFNPNSSRLNGFMIQSFDSLYTNKEIMINSLYSLEESIELIKIIFTEEDNEIWEKGLFLIGENDLNEYFFVGVNGENKDNIYWERTDLNPRFIKIANNIFEFIRGISIISNELHLGDYKFSQLYKNWGEDFWRVREDEKPI